LIDEYSLGPDSKNTLFFFNDMIVVAKNTTLSLNLVAKKHGAQSGVTNSYKYKDHFFILSVNMKDAADDKAPNAVWKL